jgi:hypothetical protein
MEVHDGAISNASFAADVGSTVYASNIISLAARKALDDYDPPTNTELTAVQTHGDSTWATATSVTVSGMTQAALAQFVTDDTGETIAVAGSVAKIAQGAAGGNVTVGAMTQAALAQFATDDTGETTSVDGSVTKLSQGSAGASGAGSISWIIGTQDTSNNPLDGVEVWITTDSGGSNVVAGTLVSDALGLTTFLLDAGTYYVWRQLSGYNFTNPQTTVVS